MPVALVVIAAAVAGFMIGGAVARERRERAASQRMHAYLHRLKNPLQSILLQAELLPSEDPRAAEVRAAIIGEAERAAMILAEQALDASGERIPGGAEG